jgi:phosphoglycolate phosphatase-like HAD superfamily hydrolase
MGGDQLVAAVAGDQAEERLGDRIRAAEKEHYTRLIGEVAAFEGARDLLADLKDRGHRVASPCRSSAAPAPWRSLSRSRSCAAASTSHHSMADRRWAKGPDPAGSPKPDRHKKAGQTALTSAAVSEVGRSSRRR